MARRGGIVDISWAPHCSRSASTAAGLGQLREEKLRIWGRNAARLQGLAGVVE